MNLRFNKLRNHKWIAVQIGLLLAISLVLRLANLGYSNFQGDELDAQCRLQNYGSPIQLATFLLGQQKGPLQYLITCAYSLIDPAFSSEAALRLPFALANLAALVCFFFLIRRLFSLQVAIHASFLFAVNGIFIAFGRIVQYQSFVILGGVAALLSLSLAVEHERWRVPGLYLAFSLAALSLLAHFDATFFLPPMAVLVLYGWGKLRGQPGFARLGWHLVGAAALFAFLVLAFYVPYSLHLGPYQTNHWENRFAGTSTDILRLFQFYNPGPILWIGLGLIILGLTRVRNTMSWHVTLAWFVPPLIFMTLIFNDSRTHAYTYILPLLVVAAVGLDAIVSSLVRRIGARASQAAATVILAGFLLLFSISYLLFVDHNPEYPWYPKRVLSMQLEGGYLVGTFGFPYSREWREIGSWFETKQDNNGELLLVTNEKLQFPAFYLPSNVRNKTTYSEKKFPTKIRAPQGIYVLVIQRPQSWMDQLWGLSPPAWHEKFVPLQDFTDEYGRLVASVYFLTKEQLQSEFH